MTDENIVKETQEITEGEQAQTQPADVATETQISEENGGNGQPTPEPTSPPPAEPAEVESQPEATQEQGPEANPEQETQESQ